jgi:hypothetical protein
MYESNCLAYEGRLVTLARTSLRNPSEMKPCMTAPKVINFKLVHDRIRVRREAVWGTDWGC